MKIILLRHGETDYTLKGITQGWSPSKLTNKGREQALNAGKKLKKHKIHKIYCSDLLRTKETAEEVLISINAPIEYVEWLREKNSGIFGGRPKGTFMKHINDNKLDLYTFTPKDGESLNTFKKRVIEMYKKFIKSNDKKDKGTVLFVTHGGVITQLLLHVLKIDDEHYYKYHPEYCAISIIEIKDGKTRVEFIK